MVKWTEVLKTMLYLCATLTFVRKAKLKVSCGKLQRAVSKLPVLDLGNGNADSQRGCGTEHPNKFCIFI